VVHPPIEDEETVEATDGGDVARDRSRRRPAGDALANGRLEIGAIEDAQRTLEAGGKPAENRQIPPVALQRVLGQAAGDTEVVEIRGDVVGHLTPPEAEE
jgi:hypothetical protein